LILQQNFWWRYKGNSSSSNAMTIEETKEKTFPGHPHPDRNLCNLICKQLEIPKP